MAASGTLVIRFIGDLKEFERATGSLSKTLTHTGSALTKSLTLPLIGAGAAAVKLATDFEHSMSLIQGLVGASSEEIAHFSDVILTEGPKWGKSPQELADALYFVTSSGFAGADALDVLKKSAMASSAGLGDTQVVADLVTSAINAYGKENLSAAESVDILAKAVELGKLEPEELAGVMGRVTPIASAMGVEFDQAAAAMSAMSMSGTDAAEGATQLRGILATLLKPTAAAEKTLAAMGTSSEELRQQLEDKGLLSVLETLKTKFDGNEAATAKVFGNVRALTGVMNMMGENVDGTRSIFDQMKNSTGAMDEAFQAVSQTTQFKFDSAMGQLKASLIQVGVVLLPMVSAALTHLSDFLSKASKAWAGLDDGTQKVILGVLGFIAAVGPVLLVLGKILAVVSALANPVGLVITAIVLLVGAFTALGIKTHGLEAALAKLMAPFTSGTFAAAVHGLVAAFVKAGQDLLPILQQVGTEIMAALGPALDSIAKVVSEKLIPAFQAILPIVAPVVGFLIHLFGAALVGVIKGAADVIVGFVTVISGVFSLIAALIHGDWSAAWQALKEIVSGAIQAAWGAIQVWLNIGIFALFKQAGKLILTSWTGLWSSVKGLLDDAMKAADGLLSKGLAGLGNLIVAGVHAFLTFWKNLATGLVTGTKTMWDDIVGAVSTGVGKVLTWIASLPGKAVSALGDLTGTLLTKGRDLIEGVLSGAKTKAEDLFAWVQLLPNMIVIRIGDIAGTLKQVGVNAVKGILAGFTSMGGWLYGQLMAWVKDVLPGPIEKALGISSPSKVFAEIGRMTAMGLALGLLDGGSEVARAAQRLADLASIAPTDRHGIATFSPKPPGPGDDPFGPGGTPPPAPQIHQHFPVQADPMAAADAAAGRIVAALGV